MTKLLGLLSVCVLFARAGCVPVNDDRIHGRDLAAANAVFSAVAPDEVIGFAPSPGRLRLFGPRELARLAARYGVKVSSFKQVCFERLAESLTKERLIPSLRKALGISGIEIHILDFSRYSLPPGQLEFSRAGLPKTPPPNGNASVIWRGQVIIATHRSIPVWVRVKLLAPQQWVEATSDLLAGRPIAPDQVTLKSGKQFPFDHAGLAAVADVAGREPVRLIRAGQIISPDMLKDPDEIERGDEVSVRVLSGGTEIRFQARAESAGGRGEIIAVQNPVSGKRFDAVVQKKGKVLVDSNARDLAVDNSFGSASAAISGGSLGRRLESVRQEEGGKPAALANRSVHSRR
jgi:flagella basal body P-ring formation protein FlgA